MDYENPFKILCRRVSARARSVTTDLSQQRSGGRRVWWSEQVRQQAKRTKNTELSQEWICPELFAVAI
jgi:hypothetical protein